MLKEEAHMRASVARRQIRGEAYECRLLKYVERGFAIGVPLLDNTRRDREHLAFKLSPCPWSRDGREELGGDGARMEDRTRWIEHASRRPPTIRPPSDDAPTSIGCA